MAEVNKAARDFGISVSLRSWPPTPIIERSDAVALVSPGTCPVGLDKHQSAGATEPRRQPNDLENVRRSRYFFLLAFFLAAGFLAAFFFAAMMVYLLHVI
jgi:hypothetical protein